MTALVRPEHDPQALHLLEQYIRRRFTAVRVGVDSLMVSIPNVGRVLIVDGFGIMRLDIVAPDQETADAAGAALEHEIRAQVREQQLVITWSSSDIIPAALR